MVLFGIYTLRFQWYHPTQSPFSNRYNFVNIRKKAKSVVLSGLCVIFLSFIVMIAKVQATEWSPVNDEIFSNVLD